MPVTTRSQAKKKAIASPQESLAKLVKHPRDASRPAEDSIPDTDALVLTPRSLNAVLPAPNPMVKPFSATRAPLSHPLPADTDSSGSDMSIAAGGADADHDPEANSFTIPAIIAPEPAAAAQAQATVTSSMEDSEPEGTAPGAALPLPPPAAKKFVPPEEKLLKPLPDKPVECTKLPDGPEPTVIEIEYPATEDLQPVDGDIAAALGEALSGMASSDWVATCGALLMLRRLVRHNSAECVESLPAAVPLVVKSIRNLRSALSKTAIMTARDLFLSSAPAMLPLCDVGGASQPMNSLLAQLLLKAASNDKKFVIEEAQRALSTMADALPPTDFSALLRPYTEHKNPKVRGKAAAVVAASLGRMQPAELAACGLEGVLNLAARLISDNTPEAREAAKRIATGVKAAVEDEGVARQMALVVPPAAPVEGEDEAPKQLSVWEFYCHSTLGASKALPVLRAVDAK